MEKFFKLGSVIASAHLVQGQGNKYTLINTYSGDILVKEFPAQLPLSFYIELIPKKFGTFPINIEISYNKQIAVQAKADGVFEKGNIAVIAMPDGLMHFEKPGILKVSLAIDGEKLVTVLRKKIRLAVPGSI